MFEKAERNRNLREQILTYHISAVMTDDERAKLLSFEWWLRRFYD